MQGKVCPDNLLGSKKVFDNSTQPRPPPLSTTLPRAGEAGGGKERDPGVSGGKIIEDYDGQKNIFSISSGPELSGERRAGRGCVRTSVRMMFNEFCETTGLHGWKYLTRVSSNNILTTSWWLTVDHNLHHWVLCRLYI